MSPRYASHASGYLKVQSSFVPANPCLQGENSESENVSAREYE
jgi:hypothetical protein